MALAPLGPMPTLRAELIPPQNAEATGEVYRLPNGKSVIVYRELLPNPNIKRVPVLDENGEQKYRHDPAKPNGRGEPLYRNVDPLIWREYILKADVSAGVKRNFNFREDEDDKLRREKLALRDRVLDDLAADLAERGLTAGDILDELYGKTEPKLETRTNADLTRLCIERGIDPDTIEGSGRDGTIIKKDLIAALSLPPPTEKPDGGDADR
jgi:hypothetical protein